MIETTRLLFRPLEREDLPRIKEWKNNERIKGTLGGFSTGFSNDDMMDWYECTRSSKDDIRFGIELKDQKSLIGFAGLYHIDWRLQKAEFGIVIGEQTLWSQGLGTEATGAVVKYGFEGLNLRRVYLEVLADHDAAIRMYEKCGFKKEGVLRETIFRAGAFRDMLVMSVLRGDPS